MARRTNTNTETKQAGNPQPERTESMDRQKLIKRFEDEMAKVARPGADKLMDYIRKSDFYTAPASTKYHLACEGGLLQHSLNVLDALRGILAPVTKEDGTAAWEYRIAGKAIATIPAGACPPDRRHDGKQDHGSGNGKQAALHPGRPGATGSRPGRCSSGSRCAAHERTAGGCRRFSGSPASSAGSIGGQK